MILRRLVGLAVVLLVSQAIAFSVLAAESTAHGTEKKYRIAMLLYRGETDAERGFRKYLQSRQVDVEYIVRDASEDPKRFPEIVREFKSLRPDLIYAFGTGATLSLCGKNDQMGDPRYISDIPVIFNIVADPVGSGITKDLKSTERNITGVTHLVPVDNQLSALKATANIKTIGVIYSLNEKNAVLSADSLVEGANKAGYKLLRYPVRADNGAEDLSSLKSVIAKIQAEKPDLLYLPSDSFLIRHAGMISEGLQHSKIPSMSATEAPIRKDGFTMGLVSPYTNAGALAGHKAYQILVEGKDPSDIPVSSLDKFAYILNMKSALKIGFYPKIRALTFAEIINVDAQKPAKSVVTQQ
jgi:putative ABC transport system substrate-binding protein